MQRVLRLTSRGRERVQVLDSTSHYVAPVSNEELVPVRLLLPLDAYEKLERLARESGARIAITAAALLMGVLENGGKRRRRR
jgi:hypothetical protein